MERKGWSADGGKAHPSAVDQAYLDVVRHVTGPRAAHALGTGLMRRLPKEKGGGVPQVGCGIRSDGRGVEGEGLTRQSRPTAKPRWARSGPKRRGRGDASRGEAREEGE